MTAVEWLLNELIFKQEYEHLPNNYFLMSDKDIDKIIEQAKQMEAKQLQKQHITDIMQQDEKDGLYQIPELSDEEIEKAAKEYDIKSTRWGAKNIFIDAIKWYSEQLKSKQWT
jgi:hypothetical protein